MTYLFLSNKGIVFLYCIHRVIKSMNKKQLYRIVVIIFFQTFAINFKLVAGDRYETKTLPTHKSENQAHSELNIRSKLNLL